MRRFIVVGILISILAISLTPASAKLPIPQGFCVQITVPIYDEGAVLLVEGLSVELIPLRFELYLSEEFDTNVYEIIGWFFTDEAAEVASFGPNIDDFADVFIDALRGYFDVIGEGSLVILPPSACSFPAYRDNAALAQTFLVPETGYDVYQIFDGNGIFSFRVTEEDLANAQTGDVLGSNEAGNITFTYNGNGLCTVEYPYPDGKMGSSSFICQGDVTDWGRVPLEPGFIIPVLPPPVIPPTSNS
ncbi:MAG: hypothetical protein KJ043_02465 [Anaerolineae bacterium]|nr:hypothetical protein [Anaerolineae bacterium]